MTIPTVPILLTKELALEQNLSMNRHNTTPGKDLTNQFAVPVRSLQSQFLRTAFEKMEWCVLHDDSGIVFAAYYSTTFLNGILLGFN